MAKKKPTPEHRAWLRTQEVARLKGLQQMLQREQFANEADEQRVAEVRVRIAVKLAQLERIG